MVKRLWLFSISILFFSCVTTSNGDQNTSSLTGTEISSLPKPTTTESSFPPYFGTISNDILLLIQNGTPSSIQKALSSLRSAHTNSEQANILLAACVAIMDYAWPSADYTAPQSQTLPSNVYASTLDSISRGIYEESFGSGDFFSLTLSSLVLFSNPNSTSFYVEAKNALEQSLAIDASSVLALYLLGVLEFRNENYQASETYLEKALSFDSSNIDIIYAYLTTMLESGKAEETFTMSNNFLQEFPSNVRLLHISANAAFDLGNFPQAESFIAQSLQFEPDNTELLLFRAKVLFELEDYLDVSSLLDVYARTSVQNKDYFILRSKLQSTWNKNIPSAIRTIQEALELYPNDTDVLLLAASLASTSSQTILGKNATELSMVILEQDSENIQALQILVKEAIAKQNWQEAYDASLYIVSLDNITNEVVLDHVEICLALGLLSEARETIIGIYNPESENEDLQQWYIRLLIAEGSYSNASDVIAKLLPGSSGRMKSMLYFERSRLQSSDERILADLRASLTSNPRNEYTLFGLYTYYYDREDYSKAQYYLKQVIALNPTNVEALRKNAELDSLL